MNSALLVFIVHMRVPVSVVAVNCEEGVHGQLQMEEWLSKKSHCYFCNEFVPIPWTTSSNSNPTRCQSVLFSCL